MSDGLWLAWTWFPFALGGAIVLVALLQARHPARRRRTLGRAALFYVLYLIGLGVWALVLSIGATRWLERIAVATAVLEIFVLVNLGAALVFELALPALHARPATLAADVSVGAAYVVTVIWCAHRLGVNVTGIVATSAVVTAVVGLSLQPTLGSIVGGIALQLDESIRVGDWIELENKTQGEIREIGWRHTVVQTRDSDSVIVPNAALLAQNIKILGRAEGQPVQHRMSLHFNVDFRYPPADVIAAVDAALAEAPIPGVAPQPRPHCLCLDFAKDGRDSFAFYVLRYWLTDLLHDDATNSAVRSRIYTALKRASIPLAVPAGTIFLSQDDSEHASRKLDREQRARVAAVDGVELFASMTPEEKAALAPRMRHAPFTRGELITRQGAAADSLFILTRGEADVRVEDGVAERIVARLHAPSFFGEMGLMTGAPRAATIVAGSEVECYRIDKADFHGILAQRPEIAREISTLLARRSVELMAARENLDADARRRQVDREVRAILGKIEDFFGLRSHGARS